MQVTAVFDLNVFFMRFLLFFTSLLITVGLNSQIRGVTEKGDEVFLYNDGTWKYINKFDLPSNDSQLQNIQKFIKDKESTFLLKLNDYNVGIYLNPLKWTFKKSSTDASRYELKFKNGDLHGTIISEGTEIPLESMKEIALENGKEVCPDLQVIKEGYKIVNGLKVLFIQMDGTYKGIPISYYAYYFSNSSGTFQFVTFSSQKQLGRFIPECEKLLNGIIEIN